MSGNGFNRDAMAKWHAQQHLSTDPGIQQVYYLRNGAPPREIRFVEVNNLMGERERDPFEPLDYGVDIGNAEGHTLMVIDVTPRQWERIRQKEIDLPKNWSLAQADCFTR